MRALIIIDIEGSSANSGGFRPGRPAPVRLARDGSARRLVGGMPGLALHDLGATLVLERAGAKLVLTEKRAAVTDHRVARVIELIETRLPAELAVESLADAVRLSPSRLRRLFVAHTGLTLSRYIKRAKLRRADDLVRTTFLSVKEIAAAVGLHDESHFLRDFKATYGATPTERRRTTLANR